MEYKRFNNKIVVRIDRGEEIVSKLNEVCVKENIKLASVNAIGATDDFTVGVYKPSEKLYTSCRFTGDYEIISLIGTVTTDDGKPYIHLHMCAGEGDKMVGGHLNSATVSVTCEMVLDVIDGSVGRYMDENIGIKLFKF